MWNKLKGRVRCWWQGEMKGAMAHYERHVSSRLAHWVWDEWIAHWRGILALVASALLAWALR